MACKTLPLSEHIKTKGDYFSHNDLLGVVVSDRGAQEQALLKTSFFDVFGFKELADFSIGSPSEVARLLAKIRQRLNRDTKQKVCLVYFVMLAGPGEPMIEQAIAALATEFQPSSCHILLRVGGQ